MLLGAFGAAKYANYESELRDHDICVGKIERSQGGYAFLSYLIMVIGREIPDRPDLVEELTNKLNEFLPVQTVDNACPKEPNFFIP